MATRNLFLIRHGQYQTALRDSGALTETGIAQAKATANALQVYPFSRIYHSPLQRARQTAQLIAAGLDDDIPLEPADLLRECIPSIPVGMEYTMRSIDPDITDEKAADCARRLDDAFAHYAQPPETHDVFEMLVCHGNVIRYFVSRTLDGSPHIWMKMLVNHCGITRLLVAADGTPYLVAHNETGHLTVDLHTQS